MTYLIVCTLLVALTVLTVAISFVPVDGLWHIVLGIAIAIGKATLVVLFFMHALISPRLTWIVIAVASLWLGILFALTLSDYVSRGSIPFMPGH
jgi:cytochrome c oxidase subunit 4